jgi:hypothetical protein
LHEKGKPSFLVPEKPEKPEDIHTWIAANDRISLGVKMSPEQVMAEMFAATK